MRPLRQQWPKVVCLGLGFVPVVVIILMIVGLAYKAEPALTELTAPTPLPVLATPSAAPVASPTLPPPEQKVTENIQKLFGTKFSTQYSGGIGRYGLTPAIVGTLMIVLIAIGLALPVSICIGVFASEFSIGPLGQILRLLLGVLAGIPPIVYALLAVVFVGPFISNKFTANWTFSTANPEAIGVSADEWPKPGVPWNAGAFPWNPTGLENSALLGGIMLALLVIPFMAPLIEDAIRNVPREPKEASLALGANRWHTLRRITLPRAMPGIVAATGLGTLKVMGDVMIVLFVVGFEASIPHPIFDPLERTGPLTSTGSALLGGLNGVNACTTRDCPVGYFSALLLLVMAVGVVLITGFVERRLRKRLAL